MYFNTHTHLNSEEQFNRRETLIDTCIKNNVKKLTVVGYDLASSKKAIEVANEYDFIYATVGISPNDCENVTEEDLKEIKKLCIENKVVALGEIGLDYYYDVDKEKQKYVFDYQLKIAKELDLPIVIHCRDAYEDTYDMLKKSGCKGIMHCYSGSDQMAKRFVNLGFYISLAGPVTFKNAKMPKLVAVNIPLESLLIETDDPYLAPTPLRGSVNEPVNCIYIAKEIAKLKDIDVSEVEKVTYENACKVFRIND